MQPLWLQKKLVEPERLEETVRALRSEKKTIATLNGSFDLIAGYPTNLGAAVNLNYRKDRLNFFANYGLTDFDSPGNSSMYQEV